MDAQQQLFGLIAVAEEHQKAINAALDKLTAERAALTQAADEVRKAAADAVPAMQKAAGEAVKQSLCGASDTAAKALSEAAKPVINSLSNVVQAARDAEGSLKNASAWFAWKWVIVASGGLLSVYIMAYASLEWQRHEANILRKEVAQLKTQADAWSKLGGRAALRMCDESGEKTGRLCVRVEKKMGYGEDSDYFILHGY